LSKTLSLAEARRIALAAQSFVPQAAAPKGVAALAKIVRRLGAVQIDSVNVLVRSHYLPVFSRCGSYAPVLLERAAYDDSRALFEYWGHEASLLPVDLYPLFRWRMDRARNGEGTWKRLRRYATSHKALVVATARDLRDYFRLPAEDAQVRVAELVEEGTLQPVTVEGWKQQGYLHVDAELPRRADVSALLSPFDSLIWERQRTERLFGFHFRLEIYTPVHKRQHGYYVLPFLFGDRLVGRVDLKANRQSSRLEVRGGSMEEGVSVGRIVEPLVSELDQLAQWLGLAGWAATSRRGELMRALHVSRGASRNAKTSRTRR
jgi:uncharacterized protein YcaQ